VTRVLIVAHHSKDDARKAAITAADWLRQHGHTAWIQPDDGNRLDLPELCGDAPAESSAASATSQRSRWIASWTPCSGSSPARKPEDGTSIGA
jgi:hypothetical protein